MSSASTAKGGPSFKPAPTHMPADQGGNPKTVGGTSAPRDSGSNTYTDGIRPKPIGGTKKGAR